MNRLIRSLHFHIRVICRDIEKAKQANTKEVQNKEMQLRHELDLLLKQPLKYTSALDVSRSYPLLFGDPDQLASRRSRRKRERGKKDI